MISSTLATLCIVLIAQRVQAWWYPPAGYGYGYHHASWYHPFGPMPYYPPHPYHFADIHHMYSTHRGAQIGAAIGSLAAHFGKKK
ncbi:hypothetical protein LOAG_00392 [Loa loa]|nr:hypothetical protein LOAG_00392 [Loa loa]EFO28080.1 hypothetical protein LOAG_00392 [Loa loa]